MQTRSFILRAAAAALVLSGPLLGYAAARHAAAAPSPARHVYRLDYTVSVTEPGRAATTSNYVLNIEEGSGGEAHAGANVPLAMGASGSTVRQDVGFVIRCQLTRAGNDLILHDTFELSGLAEPVEQGPRSIHKISAGDDAVVTPGKSTLVASIDEPTSHARYEVSVTATKLR
jgi:hypothetical protein